MGMFQFPDWCHFTKQFIPKGTFQFHIPNFTLAIQYILIDLFLFETNNELKMMKNKIKRKKERKTDRKKERKKE